MPRDTHAIIRRGLLLVLLFGIAGSSAELLLLEHHEDWRQLVPLVSNGLAVALLAWYGLGGGGRSIRALKILMVGFLLVGLAGVWFHYRGNLEFQLEIDSSRSGWELFMRVMRAKAPPALAPGIMLQLGFLGLLYSYRHPAIERAP